MNSPETILIVDDTLEVLILLTSMVESEGYLVHSTVDGESALAAIALDRPELILLDIRMPGLDGFEVCRRLKQKEETRNIPIIFISGLNEVNERVEGLKLGAVDFVTKPFKREELLVRIRTHLDLRRLHVRLEQQADDLRTANDQLQKEVFERKQAEESLRGSLREKEILLKEIHHRVKNNLAVIGSILSLQSQHVRDEKSLEIFRECENRVKSMSMVHTKLYQSKDLARIDFGAYIKELANDLFLAYRVNPEWVSLSTHTDQVDLDINKAIPLGLVVNELLSNSLKYAFPKEKKGIIEILLQSENGRITLKVKDNGVGMAKELDFSNTKTLGLQLVMALVQQLKGIIEVQRDQGTEFLIRFS
jgi:two-component sensor histidine kinase/CheY-like chemotaxis protein